MLPPGRRCAQADNRPILPAEPRDCYSGTVMSGTVMSGMVMLGTVMEGSGMGDVVPRYAPEHHPVRFP